MKRKTFKGRRNAEYEVITVCRPESIDGVSLKFRDLHVAHSVMFDYTNQYWKAVEDGHERCDYALDLHAPITQRARRLEDLIRVMFSASLSNFECLLYYLRNAMPSAEGRNWLRDRVADSAAITAFERLRNLDVHHEPLNTMIGMRFRVLGPTAVYSDIATREMHQHTPLGHEGIGLFPWALAPLKQFRAHPGLVDFLTFQSILQLSHSCIHEIAALINEAERLGHVVLQCGPLMCRIDHTSGQVIAE